MSNASELLKQLRALGVQLTLEGEVLRLNAPKGALTADFQAQLKTHKPEILELLRSMQQSAGRASALQLAPVERHALMPLSFAQQRLWFLNQMDPNSSAYALLFTVQMNGDLNEDALEQALNLIVLRHESLRTCFVQREGTPYTVIQNDIGWRLERRKIDWRDGETLRQAVSRFAAITMDTPFNLETGPLFRVCLLETGDREYVLALSVHHIVSDGWSMGVLGRELVENYRALGLHEQPKLPHLPVQYADYADWQRRWLVGDVLERQMRYWRKQLEGAPAVTMFPADHARLMDGRTPGRRAKRIFSAEFAAELNAFGRAQDSTLFMTMLAAFALLLSRYSGQKDVVIGSPSANRNRTELSELIGFFVNNLVLRVLIDDGISFRDLLKHVRETTLGAYEHQDAPFDHLVREVQSDRNAEYSPLFQTMFILHNFQMAEVELQGLTVSPMDLDEGIARFDFSVEIFPYRNELHVYFDYRSDLYEDATVDALLESFEHILRAVMAAPQTLVEAVPLTPQKAREALLAWGNNTTVRRSSQVLVHEAVERFAVETPEKIAVRAGEYALSYSELNARAETVAARLREAGAAPGVLVPVCLKRSTELIVALLGVLKTGAAYVPLDPIYPRQRIAGILDDVKPDVVVTERELLPLVSDEGRQCLLVEEFDFSAVGTGRGLRLMIWRM
jgi:Condensation domain/AMP-binding enzyme/TubC N-terminal docking domain